MHTSPHQTRAFRRGPDVVTSAEISQSSRIHTYVRHRWGGVMGLSERKSPHQARAFGRGLRVVASAEISQSSRTLVPNYTVCAFARTLYYFVLIYLHTCEISTSLINNMYRRHRITNKAQV